MPATPHSPPPDAPIDLRRAMGRFVTGVTVVTSRDATGRPAGTTANAITSLSLDPPLLLVCFARSSLTFAEVRESGILAVNVLSASQRHLADRFARSGGDDWPELELLPGMTGAPLIAGCAANLDCTVEQIVPGGDHEIVIARVLATTVADPPPEPLLFGEGGYVEVSRRTPPASPGPDGLRPAP